MLKASAYLMVSRKSVICAGVGGLRETGGLFERGAYHGGISSDLEYKVEKLIATSTRSWRSWSRGSKTNPPDFLLVNKDNKLSWISPHEVLQL